MSDPEQPVPRTYILYYIIGKPARMELKIYLKFNQFETLKPLTSHIQLDLAYTCLIQILFKWSVSQSLKQFKCT